MTGFTAAERIEGFQHQLKDLKKMRARYVRTNNTVAIAEVDKLMAYWSAKIVEANTEGK